MNVRSNATQIIHECLGVIIGLRLSLTRRTGGAIRVLHFGDLASVPALRGRNGRVGQYALHIQCPWRVERDARMITGEWDQWSVRTDNATLADDWDPEKDGCLQDERLSLMFPIADAETGALISQSDDLIVTALQADPFGGLAIHLSAGYRWVLFPTATLREHWRFFSPNTQERHLVIRDNLSVSRE